MLSTQLPKIHTDIFNSVSMHFKETWLAWRTAVCQSCSRHWHTKKQVAVLSQQRTPWLITSSISLFSMEWRSTRQSIDCTAGLGLSISGPQVAHFIPMIRHCCRLRRVNSYYKYKNIVVKFNRRKLFLSNFPISDFGTISPVVGENIHNDSRSQRNWLTLVAVLWKSPLTLQIQ
jgi:hypothetical protein